MISCRKEKEPRKVKEVNKLNLARKRKVRRKKMLSLNMNKKIINEDIYLFCINLIINIVHLFLIFLYLKCFEDKNL